MSIDYQEGRILSSPLGVEWMGWSSDTLTLQNRGWQLAVAFECERLQYQLIMKHVDMKLCAISEVTHIDHIYPHIYQDVHRGFPRGVFIVNHIAPRIEVRVVNMNMLPINSFKEIDATPMFTNEKIHNIYDLNIFSPKKDKIEQVIINQADMSVIEHLEAIKKLQSPKQQEIRKRLINDDKSRIQLVTQLVHYNEVA